jgi:hypothetical protein
MGRARIHFDAVSTEVTQPARPHGLDDMAWRLPLACFTVMGGAGPVARDPSDGSAHLRDR